MTTRTRAARAAAALILAGATMLGTAGCTFITPDATLTEYVPGEGMNLTVGNIGVRNALLLPAEDGSTASLVISLFNSSKRDAQVTLQHENGGDKLTERVYVPAGELVSFGTTPDAEQLLIETDTAPGSLLPVYVQYGNVPGEVMLVPVLNPDQPEYEAIAPR